jgi:hypothetical protein
MRANNKYNNLVFSKGSFISLIDFLVVITSALRSSNSSDHTPSPLVIFRSRVESFLAFFS